MGLTRIFVAFILLPTTHLNSVVLLLLGATLWGETTDECTVYTAEVRFLLQFFLRPFFALARGYKFYGCRRNVRLVVV